MLQRDGLLALLAFANPGTAVGHDLIDVELQVLVHNLFLGDLLQLLDIGEVVLRSGADLLLGAGLLGHLCNVVVLFLKLLDPLSEGANLVVDFLVVPRVRSHGS